MAKVRIITTRAPGLIPSLIGEIGRSPRPVVLVPESFTLACETEIVSRSREKGIFDLKIFSPSSLVREVRELTGHGSRKPVSSDGQDMIVSQVLHRCRDRLQYYRDSVAQPTLAHRIAVQLDDFARARLTPGFLRDYPSPGRRTRAKLEDMALVWEEYSKALGQGFEDGVGQWLSAVDRIRESGIVRDAQLLIYGFDYITHDILNLVAEVIREAPGSAAEAVIGLIGDAEAPDRGIFRAANDSVRALTEALERRRIPWELRRGEDCPPADPGIAFVERTLYAQGAAAEGKAEARKEPLPDLSNVRVYYAKNSYLECQHACQTLIDWHGEGVAWEEMAVAVCEQNTLPALLPLTLSAAGIPFNAKQDQLILTSPYAQYFLSLLRILRLNFCQNDMLRMMKTGFTCLTPGEVMDMENYVRRNGIHRSRWLKPFHIPEKEKERAEAEKLEELRRRLTEPIVELRRRLSRRGCSGREAAEILFRFVTDAGVYDRLLAQEDVLAAQGDDLGIDRNRQVWTAVNELLDSVASYIGGEALPLHDLCAMLESSLSSRMIKSLPQLSRAVMVAPPQMFFSSGVRRMIVMGLQENEVSSGGGVLSEQERSRLEQYIEEANREFYRRQEAGGTGTVRPFSKIGQSLQDLAARHKQDVYQAVSLARERLTVSCSGAKPSGGTLTPSTAFRRLAKTVETACPQNYTGGLMDADLRPFAPAFALEALALRLRETRDEGFLQGKEDGPWRDALASLYRSGTWRRRTQGVLDSLHVSVPAEGIPRDRAERLYATRGFTISRVETFATCPRMHLLQYGLDLFPTAVFAFENSEQGTFNHDVLQMFFDEAMKLPGWPHITESQEAALLNRVLRQRVSQWEGGILRADVVHRFQGAAIIRGVRTSVASMMRAFRNQPHFVPMATEVPFGRTDGAGPLRLPAIRIRTEDGETIAFSGRIDRIDGLEMPDGRKYFLIVDNKMSEKSVRQNSIAAGVQLQLPLYIRAAREGLAGFEPAGGLYQQVRDILSEKGDAEAVMEEIDSKLRPEGLILENEAIRKAAEPLRIRQQKDDNDMLSAVTPETLGTILDGALAVVTDSVDRIRRGETAPAPVKDENSSPCAWCDHADACLFDGTLPGCRVRELDHRSRQELPPFETGKGA